MQNISESHSALSRNVGSAIADINSKRKEMEEAIGPFLSCADRIGCTRQGAAKFIMNAKRNSLALLMSRDREGSLDKLRDGSLRFDPNSYTKEDIVHKLRENDLRSASVGALVTDSDLDYIYSHPEDIDASSSEILASLDGESEAGDAQLNKNFFYPTIKNALELDAYAKTLYRSEPESLAFKASFQAMKSSNEMFKAINGDVEEIDLEDYDPEEKEYLNLSSKMFCYADSLMSAASLAKKHNTSIENFVNAMPQILSVLWRNGVFSVS